MSIRFFFPSLCHFFSCCLSFFKHQHQNCPLTPVIYLSITTIKNNLLFPKLSHLLYAVSTSSFIACISPSLLILFSFLLTPSHLLPYLCPPSLSSIHSSPVHLSPSSPLPSHHYPFHLPSALSLLCVSFLFLFPVSFPSSLPFFSPPVFPHSRPI